MKAIISVFMTLTMISPAVFASSQYGDLGDKQTTVIQGKMDTFNQRHKGQQLAQDSSQPAQTGSGIVTYTIGDGFQIQVQYDRHEETEIKAIMKKYKVTLDNTGVLSAPMGKSNSGIQAVNFKTEKTKANILRFKANGADTITVIAINDNDATQRVYRIDKGVMRLIMNIQSGGGPEIKLPAGEELNKLEEIMHRFSIMLVSIKPNGPDDKENGYYFYTPRNKLNVEGQNDSSVGFNDVTEPIERQTRTLRAIPSGKDTIYLVAINNNKTMDIYDMDGGIIKTYDLKKTPSGTEYITTQMLGDIIILVAWRGDGSKQISQDLGNTWKFAKDETAIIPWQQNAENCATFKEAQITGIVQDEPKLVLGCQ